MTSINKKRTVCSDHSYFSYLPEEIVLLILNKIVDLKTLCRCKIVSKQFNLLIYEVDTISFVASRADNPARCDSNPSADDGGLPKKLLHFLSSPFHLLGPNEIRVPAASYECESFQSAIQSMSKFTRLKSLCIELPSTQQDVDDNGSFLYKWMVKFGSKVDWFFLLSPNSVCDIKGLNGNGQEEKHDHVTGSVEKLACLTFPCLMDAAVRCRMLLGCALDFPLLEKVLIKQSGKRGSVSISGKDIVEMRKWLHSPADSVEQKLRNSMGLPRMISFYKFPLLKLPVSGCLMTGVTLIMFTRKNPREGDDGFMNINLFNLDDIEDKEEAVYAEAVMEMLKIRRDELKRA